MTLRKESRSKFEANHWIEALFNYGPETINQSDTFSIGISEDLWNMEKNILHFDHATFVSWYLHIISV